MTHIIPDIYTATYSESAPKHVGTRMQSIDVLRAVTMFLMIFVNDISSVSNIPVWVEHADINESRLGFADTIFPAFLFIAGLSIPLAISNRINKGKSSTSISLYILSRAAALIVMGFFHVNSETYSPAAILPRSVWIILATIGFFMIWLKYPNTWSKNLRFIIRAGGVFILLILCYIYKGESDGKLVGMQTSWWGILGIIGWAYLVTSFLFLTVRYNIIGQGLLLFVFCAINILSHLNLIHFGIPIINDASSIVLMMSGMFTIPIYNRLRPDRLLYFPIAAILSITIGIILSPLSGGISKINSTPAWVFICTGLSILAFCLFAIIIDRKGKGKWFNIIKPAGTSTLTCYLIPYLLYSGFEIFHFWYPSLLNSGVPGVFRSISIAFLVILFVGYIEKKGITLKI
ncbi:DUF5009 domain-containing protein [Desertivirga brevis]|uniref:DUF5009 domain-containing protein n=1 Tax=Desertivirga brevis TaxID=2810310 RepID=UPI001A961BAB|nr:DUF5009 domain-containing protein [Pedobacter sp. SYSU D00873]